MLGLDQRTSASSAAPKAAGPRSFSRLALGERRRFIAVAIPLVVVLVAREQIEIARRWAEAFEERVGFNRLCGIRVLLNQMKRPLQKRCLVRECNNRSAAHRNDEVLGLSLRIMAPALAMSQAFSALSHPTP
jgi:hypothetical protein